MATTAGKAALNRAGQGAVVADAAALTSAASVGVPTKVEFDKVVADLVALRTAHQALLADLRTAGILATS